MPIDEIETKLNQKKDIKKKKQTINNQKNEDWI